jgi:hypothetical protein
MDMTVRRLFDRYQQFFNRALNGDPDMEEGAAFYTSAFIAASPSGVATGQNDDQLRQVMKDGYARYRALGTKEMRLRSVRVSPMDEQHCVAHVAWTAIYSRPDSSDISIEFDVHYLVQDLDGQPKIFGWVSGDEQALLKEHGIV